MISMHAAGLEYHLDKFDVVCMADFNMGAMENTYAPQTSDLSKMYVMQAWSTIWTNSMLYACTTSMLGRWKTRTLHA